jgi:tRNA pseudouridine55 synthase
MSEPVDGVLLLDKPSGITSNLALQKARRLLDAAKAGHTGTLDPLASGLLPLTFGEATKFSADLLEADKGYRATLKLGERTTTGDAEGEVISRRPVEVTRARLDAALSRLSGSIAQVPPMHSALKRDGRPLYELARAGIEVERAPRQIRVDRLAVLAFEGDSVELEIDCSKGTYVRVLAADLGELLGCGAYLRALRRTKVGRLTLEHSVTLAALEAMAAVERRQGLLPADALLASLPAVALDEEQTLRFTHGQSLALGLDPAPRVKVTARDGRLLGVARIELDGALAPQRLVQAPAQRIEH